MENQHQPGPIPPTAPRLSWLSERDGGVAILLLTVILSMVALSIATAHFMQNRSHRTMLLHERAKIYARYCSEYAVARYGLPNFMMNPELADAGQSDNNWLDPTSLNNMMNNNFMFEDNGFKFEFSYDSLKMDKVFDNLSSKPYYFVSARGIVSWRDRGGKVWEVSHTSAVGVSFSDFSRFMYFSNGEVGPENNQVTFGTGERIYGRVHINGAAAMGAGGNPTFYGLFSQTEPQVINLDEGEYPTVFTGGWIIPYQEIAWPPDAAINQIKEQRLANHTYEDKITLDGGDEHPLTTILKFDHNRYHVAQYMADTLGPAPDFDTVYVDMGGQFWLTKNLPSALGSELIYVKGVCRLDGIVRGKITVLSSDSMFIMDNIITEDTILGPCEGDPPVEGSLFGMVPIGSPNRIGLACEKDILVAATLQNGWANGLFQPTLECGQTYDPALDSNIGNICGQGRRDVIITAAIFAVECSFGAEFWKTTAWNATVPNQAPQVQGCAGNSNTHVVVWDNTPGGLRPDCIGSTDLSDRRGTIHICGSIVQTHRGFIIRNPIGPWGNAVIGYNYKNYRYDDNFLSGGPPVWFRVTYANGSQEVASEMVVPDYARWRDKRHSQLNQ